MCSFTKSVTLKNTFWTGLQRQSWADSDQSVYKSSVKEADVPWRGFVIVVPWDRSSPLKRVSGVAPVRIESSDSLQLWRCVITDRWHPGRFKNKQKNTHTHALLLSNNPLRQIHLTRDLIVAVTCWEYSRLSRSPPPRWSSLTDCVASGLSPPPGPSSSEL